ncbi:MAG: 4-(cytidine 5'-diphospho)-2-C-methyl-D-erythritol kinase [Candidatus Atribacteria bacterium]|nr:4-(cytidine 5'-diphospho)-2-C-methyl-D-erythritol kinase [Candidatus Atribacteria bacterium]MCK4308747.1 4-(cytidine 5'-diphospho)-2-C-methyl-D-erythritol kinase [Candidatus Atribacteria bacterium]
MNEIKINSYSKINLALNILDKRKDGYHEVETIIQSINLADKVIITEEKEGIKIKCNHPQVPVDSQSLAYKSAEKMLKKYGIERGVKIEIDKKIPLASGMAGGSANSATILVGINKLFSLNLSNEVLREIGEELGTDVPFCIQNGTALAYQRGEKITLLPPINPPLWIVVINPGFKISTQWAYNNLDLEKVKGRKDNTKAMLTVLKEGKSQEIAKNLFNSFEELVIKKFPEIEKVKDRLINEGALGALMSGSGPTVFGIAQNKKEALQIYEKLILEYKSIWVVHSI